MKRSAGLLVFAMLAACASPAPQTEQVVEREVVIAGGYGKADPADARVKEAEDFAVAEIYKRNPTRALVEAVDVKVQVVAGLNYAFDIKMTGGAHYKIVVFRSLQNELSITSYDKVG